MAARDLHEKRVGELRDALASLTVNPFPQRPEDPAVLDIHLRLIEYEMRTRAEAAAVLRKGAVVLPKAFRAGILRTRIRRLTLQGGHDIAALHVYGKRITMLEALARQARHVNRRRAGQGPKGETPKRRSR